MVQRQPAVRGSALERTFLTGAGDSVHAMGPLDLEIEQGEFVCLVGPSGCGKSTLLRLIGGLLRPSRGALEVQHVAPERTHIATVFQDYGIFPWKTVRRNVEFALRVGGVGGREARERSEHWLGRMGLADFADAYPATLSGGMKQRVAIARALALDPEILLMDEPFAALDAQLRQLLQEELLALWQAEQRTVIFVTHSLEEALLLGDRVLVMSARPGRFVEDVTVPFSRPREHAIRDTAQFGDLKRDLWELLRVEVETNVERRAPVPAHSGPATR